MKQVYEYHTARSIEEPTDEEKCATDSTLLYYFKPTIMLQGKKLYKIVISNHKLELDKELMKDVRKRKDWSDTDCYTVVSMCDDPITVFYK